MVISRPVPQHWGQISAPTPGQCLRARRFSQSLQRVLTLETSLSYRLSYDRDMPRTDLYLKVEIDLDEREQPERLASEICRQIRKVYGVRSAEVSNIIERET
jgi:hypothetical protein